MRGHRTAGTATLVVIIGLALVIIAAIGWAFWSYFRSGESTSKTEWSVVQAVEYQGRKGEVPVGTSVVHHDFEGVRYAVLRAKATSTSTPVWLLLNPEAEPRVKQIPQDAELHVTCGDLDRIEAQESVDASVKRFLRARCK